MPMATAQPALRDAITPIFRSSTAPQTTLAAANAWADAYVLYCLAGGAGVAQGQARKAALAAGFYEAFQPVGAGIPLMTAALNTFWVGLDVPGQTGVGASFIPTSQPTPGPIPEKSTPELQAQLVSMTLHLWTMSGVFVTVPGPAVVPIA